MKTQIQISLTRKTFTGIMLLTIFLSTFGTGSLLSARAEMAKLEISSTSAQQAHYIVFEKHSDRSISPVYYRSVELTAPLRSIPSNQLTDALGHSLRNAEQIAVSLHASNGEVIYQNIIRLNQWLRGEFSGENINEPIDGHIISLETISFVVRVPYIEDTILVLEDDQLKLLAQFDMEQLALTTPAIKLDQSIELESSVSASGPASNREDLLIMGDGYTSNQKTNFTNNATAVTASFFSISPYSKYKNYYNIHRLFTGSIQSGADHPPYNPSCGTYDPKCCSDPAMQTDPLRGKMVKTAFDSRFCTYGIHRLLVPDYNKVFAVAAAVPDWDSILLLVNDTTYGGSGGTISTVSMHASAPLIAQHEYGHSFVDLADEYESPYPGYPTCSDISGSTPCEANVTDVTDRTQLKWKPWLKSDTPIPTPNSPSNKGIVGLFQGARYLSTGMYRSGYSCIMRALGEPFCQIPSQAYVLKLYSNINLIEPNSTSPKSQIIHIPRSTSQVFRANILSPIGGPSVKITWLINGTPVPNENKTTFTFNTNNNTPESNIITLRVRDNTPLVNLSMAGNALQDKYTWRVILDAKTLTLKSLGVQDGWVLESGEFTNKGGSLNKTAPTLRLGDNFQKKQYRSILSFNTKGLPDKAVITKVTLRVKKQSIVGGGAPVLMFQGFMADVRKGFFFTSPALQFVDFQVRPTVRFKTSGPFKPALVSGWYNINLTNTKGYINKWAANGGVTQVRLRFKLDDNNNAAANYLSLYSGNALFVNRPQLVIEYYVP